MAAGGARAVVVEGRVIEEDDGGRIRTRIGERLGAAMES